MGEKLQTPREGPDGPLVAGGTVVDRHPMDGFVSLDREPACAREPPHVARRPGMVEQAGGGGIVRGGGVAELAVQVARVGYGVHPVRVVYVAAGLEL